LNLRRTSAPPAPLSLVPMIDVLLIMLVFFMVTSTFLRLEMVPLHRAEDAGTAPPPPAPGGETLLLRLAADGSLRLQGRAIGLQDLARQIAPRAADLSVVVLPSPQADTQALVAVMDAVAQAGVTRLRILRMEGAP